MCCIAHLARGEVGSSFRMRDKSRWTCARHSFSLTSYAVAFKLQLVESPTIRRTLVALNGAMANKDYQHGTADGGGVSGEQGALSKE
jgi:hypothetical protein